MKLKEAVKHFQELLDENPEWEDLEVAYYSYGGDYVSFDGVSLDVAEAVDGIKVKGEYERIEIGDKFLIIY